MIKLIAIDNRIIYELEKSELFPNYRSVLQEAIAYGIDLTRLLVESENIDNITWKGANLNSMVFRNCSMIKNEFVECTSNGLCFDKCDLTGLKVRKSNMNELHITNSNLSRLSFRNSLSYNSFILNCDLRKASFYESNITHTGFHTSNVSEVVFDKCCLDNTNFIHINPSIEWIRNASFFECSVEECEMEYVDDLSLLYFWDTDIRAIKFEKSERFTEVINDCSKVVYAIDSDVVWCKPHPYKSADIRLFRGTLEEFQEAINRGFPPTNIYPKMGDYGLEEELINTFKFLKLMQELAV